MKAYHKHPQRTLLAALFLTLAAVLAVGWVAFGNGSPFAGGSAAMASSPKEQLAAAWQRVQARGA